MGSMNRLRYLLVQWLFMLPILALADNDYLLYGMAKDHVTQEVLKHVSVSVYQDTVLVAQSKGEEDLTINNVSGYWYLKVPKEGGIYRFCFYKEGYEYLEKVVEVKTFKKLEGLRFAFNVNMKRIAKEHRLNDVVVKATKIKFYHRGDTLVYNADAFVLSEGSMLDNLIKSIPGAELNDNGEIKVNGRKVDALLLNGEDFFKGKNQILLENLPAYMVKNIKVYDRKDSFSMLKDKKPEGDYVMDVNLKKQYSIGYIGNAEVGMGSKDRYLARLFALRFTDASRIGIYSNFNNLNDTRKPGENTSWTPDKMPHGLQSQKMGGFDYLIKPKHTTHKFKGNAGLSYIDTDNYYETTAESYLDGGSTFSKSRFNSRNNNFSFNTSHQWELRNSDGVSGLEIDPSFSYTRFDRRSNSLSSTFNVNPYDYIQSKALLDSIQYGNSATLRNMMINKYNRDIKSDGHSLSSELSLKYLGVSGCYYYGLEGNISYVTDKSNSFDLYSLNYPSQPSVASESRNMYINDKPNRTLNYSLDNYFGFFTTEMNAIVNPIIGQELKTHVYSRYYLDQLDESNNALGVLPSEIDYKLHLFDTDNSYDLHQVDNYVGATLQFYKSKTIESKDVRNRYDISINFPLIYHHYRLNYIRGNGDVYSGITRRNSVLLSPQTKLQFYRNNKTELRLEYNVKQTAPSMTSLLNIENTSDPLNIYAGNSDLKNTTNHEVSLLYSNKNDKKESNFTIKQYYTTIVNALAYSYRFDRSTGIRHYQPVNVNGNYSFHTYIWHWTPLDKKRKLVIKDESVLRLNHGVDYNSEVENIMPQRSIVNTWWGSEKVELKYGIGKHSIGLKGYVGVGHVTSSRQDFNSYTLCDLNYGLNAIIKLPLNMELSTDLTMYSHYGYATSDANTNDFVWNARLSKTFIKPGITMMIDGFDIFGNLNNISQVLNSQGRTETWHNSLPRYFMIHIFYRFNKQPKKKK